MATSRLLLAALLAFPALSGFTARAGSFQDVVSHVENRMGARRMHMPGLGFLINSVTFVRRPAGASSLKLAVFEDQHFEPARFQAAVREAVGQDWKPLLQVTSRKAREGVVAYVRVSGNSFEMLIATSDSDDSTLVQLKLDGRHLSSWLRDQIDGDQHHRYSDSQ
jgi:hypothetical protein